MAPVIDLYTREFETTCVPADTVGLLDDGDLVSIPRQAQSGAETRRARAKDDDPRHAARCRSRSHRILGEKVSQTRCRLEGGASSVPRGARGRRVDVA
jgi:hypothetical protein